MLVWKCSFLCFHFAQEKWMVALRAFTIFFLNIQLKSCAWRRPESELWPDCMTAAAEEMRWAAASGGGPRQDTQEESWKVQAAPSSSQQVEKNKKQTTWSAEDAHWSWFSTWSFRKYPAVCQCVMAPSLDGLWGRRSWHCRLGWSGASWRSWMEAFFAHFSLKQVIFQTPLAGLHVWWD